MKNIQARVEFCSFVREASRPWCGSQRHRTDGLSFRQIGGRRSNYEFAEQTNLCVAYTKIRDVEKASTACDAAVAQMKEQEDRASRSRSERSAEVRAYRSDLAVALSNRGVLLAATGDAELARKDFRAAMALQTRVASIVEGNLQRLQQHGAPDA